MAIILPSLHSKNLRLTPGERRFGTALLRNLEDDYFCWVDVPVGPKQRRPDFIVLHPQQVNARKLTRWIVGSGSL